MELVLGEAVELCPEHDIEVLLNAALAALGKIVVGDCALAAGTVRQDELDVAHFPSGCHGPFREKLQEKHMKL